MPIKCDSGRGIQMLSSTYFNLQQMYVIKTCPLFNLSVASQGEKEKFPLQFFLTQFCTFLITMLEKQYFLSIQQGGHETQGGMCIHRATLCPKRVLPRRVQGHTHRDS